MLHSGSTKRTVSALPEHVARCSSVSPYCASTCCVGASIDEAPCHRHEAVAHGEHQRRVRRPPLRRLDGGAVRQQSLDNRQVAADARQRAARCRDWCPD
jgi:hypothetical protein